MSYQSLNAFDSLASFPLTGESDLADIELLDFALSFVGDGRGSGPSAPQLMAEFGDFEVILATSEDELRRRGGLSVRAVAVLKLMYAFKVDSRRGRLLH